MSFRKILSPNHHLHTTARLPPLYSSNSVSDLSKYAFGGGVFGLAVSIVSYSVGPDKNQVTETTRIAACDIEDDTGKSFNSFEECLDHICREKDKEMKQLKEDEEWLYRLKQKIAMKRMKMDNERAKKTKEKAKVLAARREIEAMRSKLEERLKKEG